MKYKALALICSIAIIVAIAGGCGWLSQLREWKNGGKVENQEPVKIEQPIQQLPEQQQGTAGDSSSTQGQQTDLSSPDTHMRDVVLYFASADGKNLEAEVRTIPRQEGIARATINQLIFGPKQEGLLPTIPAATILEDINIRDGVCTVDFSDDLRLDLPGGLNNEQLAVYSIVNTLSQFDTVKQVRILVDGQAVDTLAGHVDISTAMAPYDALIK